MNQSDLDSSWSSFCGQKLYEELECLGACVPPKSIEFRIDVDQDAEFHATLDHVASAVSMLLKSTFDTMPNGGSIMLKVQRKSAHTSEILVQDTRDLAARMAHEPAQVHKPPLEILRKILSQYGGEVSVCTNVGVGIAVSILLPAENPNLKKLN